MAISHGKHAYYFCFVDKKPCPKNVEVYIFNYISSIISIIKIMKNIHQQLPADHQRCACHSFNLIVTKDAEKAELDLQSKKVYRSVIALAGLHRLFETNLLGLFKLLLLGSGGGGGSH